MRQNSDGGYRLPLLFSKLVKLMCEKDGPWMSGNCCLPSRRLAHGTTLAINLLDCGSAMPWKCHGSKVGG